MHRCVVDQLASVVMFTFLLFLSISSIVRFDTNVKCIRLRCMLKRCAVALLRSHQTAAMTRQAATTPQSHFTVIARCKADEHINVTKYQSPRTKLTVTAIDAPGPMVDGIIVLGASLKSFINGIKCCSN